MEPEKAYSLLINVNQSILLLNPYCNKYGFEIKFFDLTNIEIKLGSLFGLDDIERPKKMGIKTKNKKTINVSLEFLKKIKQDAFLGKFDYYKEGGYYFLIKNNSSKGVDLDDPKHFQAFEKHIIYTLRLFKNGDIGSPFHFFKSDDKYHIGQLGYKDIGLYRRGNEYNIELDEIEELTRLLELNLKSNSLSNIAETFFMNCYETVDYQIKLINGMIAFESIFNRGKDQLRHIISRHTALLLSKTKEDFEKIYGDMKKLYDVRSSIVHTGKVSAKSLKQFGDIWDASNLLLNYLRRVLVQCYQFEGDKDELFNQLNMKGIKKIS